MSDTVRVAVIAAVATVVAAAMGAGAALASGAVEVNVADSGDDEELATTVTSLQGRIDDLEDENATLTSERDAAEAEAEEAAEQASSPDEPSGTGDVADGGTSGGADGTALYSDEQLSVTMNSGCQRGIDLAEPRVLNDGSPDVRVAYADCTNPNELVLANYLAEAVGPADPGVDGAGCADAVRRTGAESIGIAAGGSYCVDLGTSPVTDTQRRVVRLDVTAIDATGVTIVATAWDV